jgi:hypothetical protein
MVKSSRPDGSLDPAEDFEDNNGTPVWRARQAEAARQTHALQSPLHDFRWRFRDLTAWQCIAWFLIFPVVAMFAFYVTSILLCYAGMNVWSAMILAATPWLAVLAGRITTPNKTPARRSRRS